MQNKYKALVEEAIKQCKDIFGDKLIATYLHGSIAQNDAIPYVSDLDYFVVVQEDTGCLIQEYIDEVEIDLQRKYSFINGVHLSVHTVAELRMNSFARFVLKYNSLLWFGNDIVRMIEIDECEILEPNKKTAKDRLGFAMMCFEGAYYLMSQERFRSFLKRDVLKELYSVCPEFQTELEITRRVLDDPIDAKIGHCEFLESVRPLVQWMFAEIERA